MIFTLFFRAFKLYSIFEFFYQEILNFKDTLKEMVICIKVFLSNIFIDKKVYALAPNKEFVWVLPFIDKKSSQLRSKLVKSVHNNLSFC